MASSSQIRAWWSSYRCRTSTYTRVGFPDGWNLWVAYEAAPAFEAFASIMRKHGYLFRDSSGGTYNCRKISGTDTWSLHAYALAIDLNPTVNKYGSPLRHDYPAEFIEDVENLETVSGASVFQWGGRWGTPDAMHWQIDCSPADLATGIKEDTLQTLITILKAQPMTFYRNLQAKTGTPGGNPDYWGVDYGGTKPNDQEWADAAPVLIGAVFQAAALPAASGLTEAQVKEIVNDARIVAG